MKHFSVMLEESVAALDVKAEGVYVDGTLGRGGHSLAILQRLKNGHLYAFDLDETAIKESKERLKAYTNITYIHHNFKDMAAILKEKVDGIILDLGVSSPQFDEAQRGFSYRFDGPLDMRMDQSQTLTAHEIVNTYEEDALFKILHNYGEEPNAGRIARAIVENRPIDTTLKLVEVIKNALPAKVLAKKGHPCKQSFQALRIAVNGELEALQNFLDTFDNILKPGGRVVILTFHSLEDRLVKQSFKKLSTVNIDKHIPYLPNAIPQAAYRLINTKAVISSQEELALNHRSLSAKLRAIEKLR